MPDLTPTFSDTPACPECDGPPIAPHPAGLVYRHDTMRGCSLQTAEDARLAADQELTPDWQGRLPDRPTTAAERTLLGAAGIAVPEDARCLVEWITPGVRRRTWLVS